MELWIEDFLCNLKQRIGVNECFSQWYTVSSRIPQGSILGPILFLIFINDLPEICATEQVTVMYLYADDAKVYSTVSCDSDHLHLQKVIDHWSRNGVISGYYHYISTNVLTCLTLPG